MQVDSAPGSHFPSLPTVLPSQTLNQAVQPLSTDDEPASPAPVIPNLPKNAYGLESFADYCAAVDRVNAGLPAIEAVTPPDRSKPVILQGIQFSYWDPNHTESECSDTDSETTALRLTEEDPNANAKSTWSAGTPRRSILRQSTSSPLVRVSEVSPDNAGQNPLIYEYASTASPSSRRTSRFSSRRFSIDAGVQAESVELENNGEEVKRAAQKKRVSGARRSSVLPIKRGSVVHALAGFTGIGRADSGAVICLANGKKFELIVDTLDREDGKEIAVQCSGLEIDSEIEAKFGVTNTEVIDVDAHCETPQTGVISSDHMAAGNSEHGVNFHVKPEDMLHERMDDIPSPEQLRSAKHAFGTPIGSVLPDLELAPVSGPEDNLKKNPAMPTLGQQNAEDEGFSGQVAAEQVTGNDEIAATSEQVATKRMLSLPTSTPKARVSAPGRITVSHPNSIANMPEALPDEETKSQQTAPPAVKFSELPRGSPVHAIADPTKTPVPEPVSLGIVREQSFSLKPEDGPSLANQLDPSQTQQSLVLHLDAVKGMDICPTASAYQMAAMATLSPQSYLRAIQPSQPQVVYASASAGGRAPRASVNTGAPQLMSTPPVATVAVAPNSHACLSLAAAPRKSHVSITRSELRTPLHDPRPVNVTQEITRGCGNMPHDKLANITPSAPALPLDNAKITESEALVSRKEESSVCEEAGNAGYSEGGPSSRAVISQDIEEHQGVFADDDDDDFGALPDMDDDSPEISVDIEAESDVQPELETAPNDEAKSPLVSRSRKASMASSKSRASRKTHQSSDSERRRMSSVTKDIPRTPSRSDVPERSVADVEEMPEIEDLDALDEEEISKKRKKTAPTAKAKRPAKKAAGKANTKRGQKRLRQFKSLSTAQVNDRESGEEGGLRRSKRQRFPRLKFWRNETVSYERRLSQAIPTIAEVIVDVGGSESDDDTWFGRR